MLTFAVLAFLVSMAHDAKLRSDTTSPLTEATFRMIAVQCIYPHLFDDETTANAVITTILAKTAPGKVRRWTLEAWDAADGAPGIAGLAGLIERALQDTALQWRVAGKVVGRQKGARDIERRLRGRWLADAPPAPMCDSGRLRTKVLRAEVYGPETAEEKMLWANFRLEQEFDEGTPLTDDEEDWTEKWTEIGERRRSVGSPERQPARTEAERCAEFAAVFLRERGSRERGVLEADMERVWRALQRVREEEEEKEEERDDAGTTHHSSRATVEDQSDYTDVASACDYDGTQRRRLATTTAAREREEQEEKEEEEAIRYVAAATAQVRQMAAMSPPFTPVTEEATERGAEREGEIRKDLFAAGAPGLRGDLERESEGRWDSVQNSRDLPLRERDKRLELERATGDGKTSPLDVGVELEGGGPMDRPLGAAQIL